MARRSLDEKEGDYDEDKTFRRDRKPTPPKTTDPPRVVDPYASTEPNVVGTYRRGPRTEEDLSVRSRESGIDRINRLQSCWEARERGSTEVKFQYLRSSGIVVYVLINRIKRFFLVREWIDSSGGKIRKGIEVYVKEDGMIRAAKFIEMNLVENKKHETRLDSNVAAHEVDKVLTAYFDLKK